MIAPAAVLLGMFVLGPLVLGGYWSLTDKRLISPLPTHFVGLKNYRDLLGVAVIPLPALRDASTGEFQRSADGSPLFPRGRTVLRGNARYQGYREAAHVDIGATRYLVAAADPTFYRSLWNIVLFVVAIVPLQGGLALVLALLVNQRLAGATLFRTAYFSPVVTSMAVISIVWTFLYNPDAGLINSFLHRASFGLIGDVHWLTDPRTALIAIIVMSAWQAAGFQMVIFLAGLQQIPQVLYEAARIDGAGGLQRMWYVTLPQLRNTTVFVIISTTILAFRLFTQVDVMTKGGPLGATTTVVFHAVNEGFRQQRIGYASAITMVFFAIVMAVALVQRLLLRSEGEPA